jgi:coenzyme F420-0:L-glutamate ligase/coenzyme F420-1:gamma-L-glutamate ligase
MVSQDDLTALVQAQRIGHLATADSGGTPHLVPICFAYDGHAIYSAIDHKPKRRTGYGMKRIRNIIENPRVAFLVHHYEEDWQQLYYVLMRGTATVLESGPERQRALLLLEDKYVQYRERQLAQGDGLVIRIVPEHIQRWGWQGS